MDVGSTVTTVFLDTETLGLDRAAPVWEFAAIRVNDNGIEEARQHFQIQHNPNLCGTHWPSTLPEKFFADYVDRYDVHTALPPKVAAGRIADIVDGRPTIAGSNPGFDMERLGDLLDEYGLTPGWHYHPLDVPTMALGWLAARPTAPMLVKPWKSDAISLEAGVDPANYERHTAMGDAQWCRDLYTVVGGGVW